MAGFNSMGDLAEKLRAREVRGLGTTVLYQTEREERVPDASELREIAEACGLPFEWFTADLNRLNEISDDPRTAIAQMLAAARQVLAQRLAEASERSHERRSENPAGPESRSPEDP